MKYSYQDYKNKLDNVINNYADKSAVVYLQSDNCQKNLNYSEIKDIINKLKTLLCDVGLNRADRIAVVSPHTPFAVILNLSLAYLGYTAVLIDAALPEDEQKRLIEYSDVNAIFTTKHIYSNIKGCFGNTPTFEICNDFSYCLFKESVTCVNNNLNASTNEDVIAIIFSSGTTSTMKGVEITYHSICKAFDYTSEYVFIYLNPKKPVKFLNVLPSNHIAGYSVATSCVMKGGEMGFISEVNAQNLGIAFQVYQPSVFIMIPQVYSVIKNKILSEISKKSLFVKMYFNIAMSISHWFRKSTGRTLSFLVKPISKVALGKNMKYCGCGTAPCSDELLSFYLDLGMDFVNVYGTTETGFPVATSNCYKKYSINNAINTKGYSEVDVKICDIDSDNTGELRVKTPLIMNGYFKEPELTKAAFDENGYFKTGDIAYIDTCGNIHITGRIKESILLPNGKKVSPSDIDEYYSKICNNVKIASCGVPVKNQNYDEICMFIESNNHLASSLEDVKNKLLEYSSNTNTLFKINRIQYIDKIPMTSVGKIKRFELKNYAMNICSDEIKNHNESNGNHFTTVINCIKSVKNVEVEMNLYSKLIDDLGFDSLALFELCVEIENVIGINITDKMYGVQTVEDIIKLLDNPVDERTKKYNINDFPISKTSKDLLFIKHFKDMSNILWNLKVKGIENIPQEERLIFCPNHESYFDAMWVAAALEKNNYDTDRICCIAAEHLMQKKTMKKAFIALGGIPVDRCGNTAPAIEKAKECLKKDKCYMLIHPEGTRSRTGELGDFKDGAAMLSLDSNVKIIPVCINGAYEIFPPHRKLPKVFDWKHFRRHTLEINFGKPIDPHNKKVQQITNEIRLQIVEIKNQRSN